MLPSGAGRTVSVRRGSILAVSPFISHRDTRLFPDAPGAFRPQRYAAAAAAAAGDEGSQPGASADISNGVGAKSVASVAEAGLQLNAGTSGSSRVVAAASGRDARQSPAASGSGGGAEIARGRGDEDPAANGGMHSKAEAADEFGAIPGVSQTGMAFGGGRFR